MDEMKYGQIAGNGSINAMIYRCFTYLCEEDERRFVKKFSEHPHNQPQVMHTFRELILGAYLGSNGFHVRYDRPLRGKTPDWSIVDEQLRLSAVVELTNFHVSKVIEDDIKRNLEASGGWVGRPGSNIERLYQCLRGKISAYRGVISEECVPYIVAVFGTFFAAVPRHKLETCVLDKETGLFKLYEELTGVLFFVASHGRYSFSYIVNPKALRAFHIPSGVF